MRETHFIEQNKDKWAAFEQQLEGQQEEDPRKLNELFIQVTDDLSYSRTFYNNRSVRVYLNGLAQSVFFRIYKNQKTRLGTITDFWLQDLPLEMYAQRRSFLLSFLIFLGGYLIGFFSSYMDPDFPNIMLGDAYIAESLQNIEKGDPMAIYKDRNQLGMSLGITLNNIFVAFLTYILGVFFSLGTIGILIRNATMIGAWQFFFMSQDLLVESSLTIWMHGTLEISAIIIAGAAGITLGTGLLFPGTFSRLRAFQMSARKSFKLLLGTVPIFILAGIVEGFFTRYTEAPNIVRLVFILACLGFVLFYFVWYPRQLVKRLGKQEVSDYQLPPDQASEVDLGEIYGAGESFTHIFLFVKKHLGLLSRAAFLATLVFGIPFFLLSEVPFDPRELVFIEGNLFGAVSSIDQFFYNEYQPWTPLLQIPALGGLLLIAFSLVHFNRWKPRAMQWSNWLINYGWPCLLTATVISFLFYPSDWYVFFLFLPGLVPMILCWGYIMFVERSNPFAALGRMWHLGLLHWGRLLSLALLNLSISLLFFVLLDTSLYWIYVEFLSWNISVEGNTLEVVLHLVFCGSILFTMYWLSFPFFLGVALQYYSLLEMEEAETLSEQIRGFGKRKKIMGLERE